MRVVTGYAGEAPKAAYGSVFAVQPVDLDAAGPGHCSSVDASYSVWRRKRAKEIALACSGQCQSVIFVCVGAVV